MGLSFALQSRLSHEIEQRERPRKRAAKGEWRGKGRGAETNWGRVARQVIVDDTKPFGRRRILFTRAQAL